MMRRISARKTDTMGKTGEDIDHGCVRSICMVSERDIKQSLIDFKVSCGDCLQSKSSRVPTA